MIVSYLNCIEQVEVPGRELFWQIVHFYLRHIHSDLPDEGIASHTLPGTGQTVEEILTHIKEQLEMGPEEHEEANALIASHDDQTFALFQK